MATPVRHFRSPDELWGQALKIAEARGESLSSVLNDRLARYVRKHQAELEAQADKE